MRFTAVDRHAGRTASAECHTIKVTAHAQEAIDCNKIYISNKVSSISYTLNEYCSLFNPWYIHESKNG